MNNKKIIVILLLLGSKVQVLAQSRYTISGTVTDRKNGETVIGASVYIRDDRSAGATTNAYGFYSITVPQGKYQLIFTMTGYQNDTIDIDLIANMQLNKPLTEKTKELAEVVVSSKKENENILKPQMGLEKLSIASIARIPVIFGEKDILKTAQLLPGIKSSGEGSSGFYVRGGAADQNLLLLDEAPVYNASHLLGFFSVFNSDALKDVTIIKGNSPAQYGGRLSSVLDVKMKDGNNKKLAVTGGIGTISSRVSVESPFAREKGSFIVSGRRTYADLFLKLSENDKENKLYFYDFNAKANYRVNDKNKIFISGYLGRDVLAIGKQFGIEWGNKTATARWNYVISPRLFSNASFIYSNYNYKMNFGTSSSNTQLNSEIQDFNLKEELQYYINSKNTMKLGFNVIRHELIPTRISGGNTSAPEKNGRPSLENAAFVNNTWRTTEKLTVDYGLRFSAYSILGGDTYNIYDHGVLTDSVVLAAGKFGKTYLNLEPRIQFNYLLNEYSSIKGGYARNTQHLHLLTNTTSSSPTDQWIGNSYNIKPEISDQYSLGYARNFKNNIYQASIEVYYKDLKNQIDYKEAADLNTATDLESELLFGKGRAYGAEFLIKKTQGRLTGWIGYTLAKTERKIDGINSNNWYNAKQDRTHDISVVAVYQLSSRWSLSGLFVYSTGNAVSFPSGKYEVGGQTTFYYIARNVYRMPAYHRMDIGATYTRKKRNNRESSWNFSLYNVYGRENAYSITFADSETDPTRTVATQTSLFRWVPSVTYNFKF